KKRYPLIDTLNLNGEIIDLQYNYYPELFAAVEYNLRFKIFQNPLIELIMKDCESTLLDCTGIEIVQVHGHWKLKYCGDNVFSFDSGIPVVLWNRDEQTEVLSFIGNERIVNFHLQSEAFPSLSEVFQYPA
ncbi:MAG TPA: hypothetical protein VHA74_03635, partial [Candidatus Dojkabacteria bacterium]|nr:hypothetical protein [Candidatus Dojkabacteria bacterium]